MMSRSFGLSVVMWAGLAFVALGAEVSSDAPTITRLFLANGDGSGLKPLPLLPGYAYYGSPRWSPDGKLIAFNAWKQGESDRAGQIAVVGADGSDPRILGDGLMPCFSPDGKQLVFCRHAPNQGVWTMKVDAPGEPVRIAADGWGADWSSRGTIGYVIRSPAGANLALHEPGSERRELVFNARELPYASIYWGMAWSPDGKRLILKGRTKEGKFEVGIVEPGRKERMLVRRLQEEVPGGFSWTSSQILFCRPTKGQQGRLQLYSLHPDTHEAPEALPGQDVSRSFGDVAGSPDGKRIAVSVYSRSPLARRAERADLAPEKTPAQYVARFRGDDKEPNAQELFVSNPSEYLSWDADGLRLHLPADQKKPDQAGITAHFGIRGDFELIAVFHGLKVHKPAEGWGAGFDLLLQMGTGPKDFILVERKISGSGENVFATKHAHVSADGEYTWRIHHAPPNETTAGKIKIVRKGMTVYYLFAELDSDQYDLLDELPIGADDVRLWKFVACAKDQKSGADLVLEKLSIRAEAMPELE